MKIVKKGSDKDHFLLVSVNPEFEEQEIPKSIINHVFLVKLMLKNEVVRMGERLFYIISAMLYLKCNFVKIMNYGNS